MVNIASLRKVNIAHPYSYPAQTLPTTQPRYYKKIYSLGTDDKLGYIIIFIILILFLMTHRRVIHLLYLTGRQERGSGLVNYPDHKTWIKIYVISTDYNSPPLAISAFRILDFRLCSISHFQFSILLCSFFRYVFDQTAIFTHETKRLISICWKCYQLSMY